MTPDPDRLFRAYRAKHRPEPLAQLFDLTAPRLLRVAIHLCGDAAEAEDLVQATFVAAIEDAERFEDGADVLAWLIGILTNKARHGRRQAAREVDPERLLERTVATPLDEAAEAEFQGELARAIDAQPDTFRQALVLRLRHGMKTADIAHVLGVSPGAVRVRLSRGMERLRESLPAGLASALFSLDLDLGAGRGLAAVREAVLGEAQRIALVTGTSTLTVGGLLMTKKALLGAAALAAVVATSLWYADADVRGGLADPAGGVTELAAIAPDALADRHVEAPEEPDPERVVVEARAENRTMVGQVIDRGTGRPLSGVRVELYSVEELTLREFKERELGFVEQESWHGRVRARASWPDFDTDLSDAQRLGVEPVRVRTRPPAGAEPLGVTQSGEAGRFEVELPVEGATLVCSLGDYGVRHIPLRDTEGELLVYMRRPGRIAGQVIDTRGEPVLEEVELVFWGGTFEPFEDEGEWVRDTEEAWVATTAPDGSFDLVLPAASVAYRILTPGLMTAFGGIHPDHQQSWYFDRNFEPGGPNLCACGEAHPLYIVAQRVPHLRVFDALSGAPIEHFALLVRELANGYPRWSGHYYAPGGVHPWIADEFELNELKKNPLEVTVWAEGYRESAVRLERLDDAGVIEFALAPGTLPSISGVVQGGGRPLPGAHVSLQAYGPLQWSYDNGNSLAMIATDAAGGFWLEAPPGDYVLHVRAGERVCAEPITLPRDAYRSIDLDALGQVVVEVRDEDGRVQAEHTVVLKDGSGRNVWEFTDERGLAEIGMLPDGEYEVRVPRVATEGSFSGGISETVVVAGATPQRVAFTVPSPDRPRRVRIVTDSGADLAGWRARSVGMDEPVALEPDGTVPIDFNAQNYSSLIVYAADARRFQVDVPDDAPDGYEILLTLTGPRYEGVLLDLASGKPATGVRIGAYPVGTGEARPVQPSTATDDEGRFALDCEHDVVHRLHFGTWYERPNPHEGLVYITDVRPTTAGARLELRLPRRAGERWSGFGEKTVAGRVLDADGEPVENARAWLHAVQPDDRGRLEIWGNLLTRTDADGRFRIAAPDVETFSLHVSLGESRTTALKEEWSAERGQDEEREFELPSLP
jgi:RNA polymerase sigma-70 factor (ECF subfamily)